MPSAEKALPYLFAAYTVIWVVVFGYTLSIGARQRKLAQDLDLIKRAVEKRAAK